MALSLLHLPPLVDCGHLTLAEVGRVASEAPNRYEAMVYGHLYPILHGAVTDRLDALYEAADAETPAMKTTTVASPMMVRPALPR